MEIRENEVLLDVVNGPEFESFEEFERLLRQVRGHDFVISLDPKLRAFDQTTNVRIILANITSQNDHLDFQGTMSIGASTTPVRGTYYVSQKGLLPACGYIVISKESFETLCRLLTLSLYR